MLDETPTNQSHGSAWSTVSPLSALRCTERTRTVRQVHALKHLKAWLSYHPEYAHIVSGTPSEQLEFTLAEEVTRLFHLAADQAPDDPQVSGSPNKPVARTA